jgi:AmmeMemoRadiSam system protein A
MSAKTGRNQITGEPASAPSGGAQASPSAQTGGGVELPALARRAVEIFVLERRVIGLSQTAPSPLLSQRLPCFVCIKTFDRDLRGCIGMIEPEKETLAEEVVANAISAATCDPRFRPVSADELPFLHYSVDVLDPAEPARLEDLDPAVFGVIVTDHRGLRRGLLLPNIEGIATASQQVQIAARKAGIAPHEPLRLLRFRARRFKEFDDLN